MTATRTLRTLRDLDSAGLLDADEADAVAPVVARYALAVTPAMAALIDPADPADPIARQFLPDPREIHATPGEMADPIGDAAHSPVKGVVHRYPDRALLKLTHLCPVYCRFCFRREVVGPDGEGTLTTSELDAALAYVAATPTIREVIVTGGDPLTLSLRRIAEVARRVSQIGSVSTLRWHSRVPIVAPERITESFVAALTAYAGATWLGVHANHPREFTPQAKAALARLADAGVAMVSQTVLLRGVNDDVDTLAELMRAFVAARVKPYYLHHADLAPGTGHFRTSLAEGRALVAALRGRLSGLMQPTYVLDLPGGHGKARIMETAGDVFHGWRGDVHLYPQGGDQASSESPRNRKVLPEA